MPEGQASVKVASDRPVTPLRAVPQILLDSDRPVTPLRAVPQILLDVGRDLFPEPHLGG
jgi:hypothetical protein